MKISNIECLVVDGLYPYVIINTDQGITGVGECFRRAPWVIKSAIETVFSEIVLGKDPTDSSNIWNQLYESASVCGPHGSLLTAISGIDIAIWDINLQVSAIPLHSILGSKKKNQIKLYASSMKRDMSPEEEADRAAFYYDQGYSFYKMHSAYPEEIDSPRDRTIQHVEAIRKKLGDKLEVMVDVNGAYSIKKAIEIGKHLQDLNVFQFEQPVHVTDLDGLKQVSDSLDIPVASGECCYTLDDFKHLIKRGNPDIVQPDVVKTGGITELLKIFPFIKSQNKSIMIHNTQPLISTAVHAHFLANDEDLTLPLEYNIEKISIRDNPIIKNNFEAKNGMINVPESAGIGLDFDISEMRKRQTLI